MCPTDIAHVFACVCFCASHSIPPVRVLLPYCLDSSVSSFLIPSTGTLRVHNQIHSHTHTYSLCVIVGDDMMPCCGRCKSAFYCNISCQKAAWQSHKPTCLEKRKCCREGTCQQPPPPPSSIDMINVCAACDKPLTFVKRCALCLDVMYCDRNCQFVHYNSGHRLECIGPSSYISAVSESEPVDATSRTVAPLNMKLIAFAGVRACGRASACTCACVSSFPCACAYCCVYV